MIIVDTALKQRAEAGKPIQVAMTGAGYMGKGIAAQILRKVPGMRLAGISSRRLQDGKDAYRDAGATEVRVAETVAEVEQAIRDDVFVVVEDGLLLCQAEGIDAVVEVTGDVEFGAQVTLSAVEHGKHIILMNAEVDATVGPLLKTYADKHQVVYTNSDGDQPGVIMNLLRYVESIGMRPVLAGNVKGLQDPYRNPETQRDFAARFNQKPQMVASFADGTKVSMEMAVVANATGFCVGQRGMYGKPLDHVKNAPSLYDTDALLQRGQVDYVLRAEPPAGVFIIAYLDDPLQKQYLQYYKLGDGPFYVFYNPYHICTFEVPLTVARAVLFNDAAIAPVGAPQVDVVATAKRDVVAGETLDGLGGFCAYGVAENSDVTEREGLLPMGLAPGCRVIKSIKKDDVITYADVELPPGRLIDRLRQEQREVFRMNES